MEGEKRGYLFMLSPLLFLPSFASFYLNFIQGGKKEDKLGKNIVIHPLPSKS
jgi:hypothetical protein